MTRALLKTGLLGILVCFVLGYGQTATAIPPSEHNALIALYHSTNGANWTNKTNWLEEGEPECSWYGVICNGTQTAVIRLELFNNRLSGTIPKELGQLTQLQRLYLWGNQLSGTIPKELGQLTQLQVLYLDNNQLSGTIPPELGQLTELRELFLNNNQLSGEIPSSFLNLTNLLNNNAGSLRANYCLNTNDSALTTFLDAKFLPRNWREQNCPDYSFTPISPVALNTLVESATITRSGLVSPVMIQIDFGQFRNNVDITGWINTPAMIEPGQSVQVRHVSANAENTSIENTLTIAAASRKFRSTTGRLAPDAFAFPAQTNVPLASLIESAVLVPTGYTLPTPLHIVNGEYRIDGGAWSSANTTLAPGQSVQVRHLSASNANQTVTTTLTLGGVSGTFSSTTERLPVVMPNEPEPPVTPAPTPQPTPPARLDPFSFEARDPVPLDTLIESNVVILTGSAGSFPITITDGEYRINGGPWQGTPDSRAKAATNDDPLGIWTYGQVRHGDHLQVRLRSANRYGASRSMTIMVGEQQAQFVLTTYRSKLPETTRTILREFYAATNGAHWLRRDGWENPDSDECTWYGVQCDAQGQHITALTLPHNQLTGELPASVLQWPQHDLAGNCLTSDDPAVKTFLKTQPQRADCRASGTAMGRAIPVAVIPPYPQPGEGRLQGHLLDACTGTPIAGIILGTSSDAAVVDRATGQYTLDLPLGSQRMIAYAKDYDYRFQTVQIAEGLQYHAIELEPLVGCAPPVKQHYKFILLAGGGPVINHQPNALWESTRFLTDHAYHALRQQGVAASDIAYLSADPTSKGADMADVRLQPSTLATLQTTLTQWAQDSEHLVIYLADHGGREKLQINGSEDVTAAQLRAWSDAWLSAHPEGTITLIFEACKSGSFLSLGSERRIIIASTLADHAAVIGNQGLNAFSYFFWSEIGRHARPAKAFRVARQAMSAQRVNAADTQNAQLDSNGDQRFDASDYEPLRLVCYGDCQPQPSLPAIDSVTPGDALLTTPRVDITATVSRPVTKAWFTVQAPNRDAVDPNLPFTASVSHPLTCDPQNRCRGHYADFETPGTYLVTVYVQDSSGKISLPRTMRLSRPPANRYDPATLTLDLPAIKVGTQWYAARLSHNGDFQFTITELKPIPAPLQQLGTAEYQPARRILVLPRIEAGAVNVRAILQAHGEGATFRLIPTLIEPLSTP